MRNELGEKIHKELRACVCWLEVEYENTQWVLKQSHKWMVKLEACLEKLEGLEVVDLTQEEDEGGVGVQSSWLRRCRLQSQLFCHQRSGR